MPEVRDPVADLITKTSLQESQQQSVEGRFWQFAPDTLTPEDSDDSTDERALVSSPSHISCPSHLYFWHKQTISKEVGRHMMVTHEQRTYLWSKASTTLKNTIFLSFPIETSQI